MSDSTTTEEITTTSQQPATETTAPNSEPQFDLIDGEQVPRDIASVTDPDLREYYQLMRDGAGRQQGSGEGTTQPGGSNVDAATQPTVGADAGAQPQPVMIPKARLDDALAKSELLRQQVAFLQGKVSVMQQPGAVAPQAGGSGGEQQQPTQQAIDPLVQARAELKALAKKYDDGEDGVTLERYEELRAAIEDRIDAIREARLMEKVGKQQTQQQPTDPTNDLLMQERIAAIETQHPYSALVFPDAPPADPAQARLTVNRINMIREEAEANLAAAHPGVQFSNDNPRHRLLLIEEQAKLADKYGPLWFPNANVKPATTTGGGNGAQANRPLSPQASDRLKALQTAQQQPANIHQLGSSGNGNGEHIDAATIAGMTDDQIARLPDHMLDRLLQTGST